MYRSFLIA
jgi:hypothetical protein